MPATNYVQSFTPPHAAAVRDWIGVHLEEPEMGRIKAIEGARGVAIFFVFLIHLHEFLLPFTTPNRWILPITGFLYTVGNLAGDFFLVLTGCLVYRSLLARPTPYFQFVARRLSRVYSVFLCVLSLYLLLSILFPSNSKLPADGLGAGLYLAANVALLPGLLPIRPIISVSWTLSFIVFFYLTVPLLIERAGMRAWTASTRAAFIALLLISSSWLCIRTGIVPLRLNMLLVGVLLAEFDACIKRRPLPMWAIRVVFIAFPAGIAIRYWLVQLRHLSVLDVCRTPELNGLTAVCLFSFCFCLLTPGAPLNACLSWRPLRWFGSMSYSYYLSHSLAIKFLSLAAISVIARWANSEVGFWAIQLPIFVFSLIPAIVLFSLVEKRRLGVPKKKSLTALWLSITPSRRAVGV